MHDFKVYVDGVQIIKNGVYAININFTIYNPSDQNLRLKYLRPLVELNGRSIELEDPPFLKPQPGTVFNLLANKNTTLVFSKNLKSWNLNAENGLWFFIVYITVEGLPLVEMATLQRVVKYKW
ncbi:MAG: hypothetical protein QMD23_00095 [Candidatus Bathyarchaeia archaeon]|nr:hypothetical protein [Candidatus Bathyarchaeia archaeon]